MTPEERGVRWMMANPEEYRRVLRRWQLRHPLRWIPQTVWAKVRWLARSLYRSRKLR